MLKWILRKIGIWIYRLFETEIDKIVEYIIFRALSGYGLVGEYPPTITEAPDVEMEGAILDKSNEHFHVVRVMDLKGHKDIPEPHVLQENIGKHKFVDPNTAKIAKDGFGIS